MAIAFFKKLSKSQHGFIAMGHCHSDFEVFRSSLLSTFSYIKGALAEL